MRSRGFGQRSEWRKRASGGMRWLGSKGHRTKLSLSRREESSTARFCEREANVRWDSEIRDCREESVVESSRIGGGDGAMERVLRFWRGGGGGWKEKLGLGLSGGHWWKKLRLGF